jgi:hypothetical protein
MGFSASSSPVSWVLVVVARIRVLFWACAMDPIKTSKRAITTHNIIDLPNSFIDLPPLRKRLAFNKPHPPNEHKKPISRYLA